MNNKYSGMTVNERLWASGLTDKLDIAVRDKNIDGVIFILKQVDLTEESIHPILKYLKLIKDQ
jgi:hypothetical protein